MAAWSASSSRKARGRPICFAVAILFRCLFIPSSSKKVNPRRVRIHLNRTVQKWPGKWRPLMAGKLEGKIALVTGGSSGIGLATAQSFILEGAFVFITGRRQYDLYNAVTAIGGTLFKTVRAEVFFRSATYR